MKERSTALMKPVRYELRTSFLCVEKNISNQVKCYSRVVRVNSEESVAVRDAANNCHSYFGFYKWCR